jgi:hypothetical protein
MKTNEDYVPVIGRYECLVYNSKSECKSCDGFGRNSDKNVKTESCYITIEKMREEIGIGKLKINNA